MLELRTVVGEYGIGVDLRTATAQTSYVRTAHRYSLVECTCMRIANKAPTSPTYCVLKNKIKSSARTACVERSVKNANVSQIIMVNTRTSAASKIVSSTRTARTWQHIFLEFSAICKADLLSGYIYQAFYLVFEGHLRLLGRSLVVFFAV